MGKRANDCTHRWQAEAAEEGRLGGRERFSFQRHRASCEICEAEQRALGLLRKLGHCLPEHRPTELERRRLRREILRRADAVTTHGASARRQQVLGTVALAAALLLVVLGPWVSRSAGFDRDRRALLASGASSGTEPSRPSPPSTAQPAPREVTSRTEAFAIPSPDPAPLRANAGEAALPNPVPKSAEASARASMASGKRASAAGVSSESASGLGQGKRVAAAVMAESAAPRSGLRDRTPRAPSEASARVSAETAGLAFAQAFDAFSRGAYEVAEERFLRFEREYRTDTRVEDAAFLRAICRQRRGDRAGAARDADEYLRKFPSGFRRREAEAILVSH